MTVTIAGVQSQPTTLHHRRLTMLLWGDAGVGKTTLACTAPGNKLLLCFDPGGTDSISRSDTEVVDLSHVRDVVVEQAKARENPFGLKTALAEFDTLVFDGLTNFQYMSVMHGISTTRNATIENPSKRAYQTRNALVISAVKNILKITASMQKHTVFVAHAAAPEHDDEGNTIAVSIALGGQLISQVPVDYSEVWCILDVGNRREIIVRPHKFMRPCKTRLFETPKPMFIWKQPSTGTEIADWYRQWQDNGWKKLPLPQ